jgi:hypothetical protein
MNNYKLPDISIQWQFAVISFQLTVASIQYAVGSYSKDTSSEQF